MDTALDASHVRHGGKLLTGVEEKILYESALTVMMRLVFLFCAEERELLLLGDDLYDKNYAVSTPREQLEVAKSEHTEEILGLRYDAWPRLLTTFRAVYAGVKHDRLKLPAYGGSLFDLDHFPFLEGRPLGTRIPAWCHLLLNSLGGKVVLSRVLLGNCGLIANAGNWPQKKSRHHAPR